MNHNKIVHEMQIVVQNKNNLTPVQVLAQILKLARMEKERRDLEDGDLSEKLKQEEEERKANQAPPGFKNKVIFYAKRMIIYPEDKFRGLWDLIIFG